MLLISPIADQRVRKHIQGGDNAPYRVRINQQRIPRSNEGPVAFREIVLKMGKVDPSEKIN